MYRTTPITYKESFSKKPRRPAGKIAEYNRKDRKFCLDEVHHRNFKKTSPHSFSKIKFNSTVSSVSRLKTNLQNIKAYTSICIYIWMEHFGDEFHGGRLIWILLGELESQLEGSIFEGRILGAEDYRLPHEYVIFGRCTAYTSRRILLKYCFLSQSIKMTTEQK